MKTIKVAEATGPALDWLVAKCEWVQWTFETATVDEITRDCHYSTDWAQGGPIIDRELIDLLHVRQNDLSTAWDATFGNDEVVESGPTALIAAMRCYVASKLGETAEVPEELT